MRSKHSCLYKTLEYLFVLERGKRFWTLFLLSLPTGFLVSSAMPEQAFYKYFSNYVTGNIGYWNTWNYNGALDYRITHIAGVLAFMVYLFVGAIMYTVVSRSLRVGVFRVSNPISECNESFFPTLYSAVFYLIILVLVKAVNTALTTFFLHVGNAGLSLGLTVTALILMYVWVSYVMTIGTLHVPFMVFNGLNPFRAFVMSAGRISGKTAIKTFPQIFLPVLLTVAVGTCAGIAQSRLISAIVGAVAYAMLITYLTAYSFVSYYEVNDMKREDYTREYYYRHGRD